MSVALSVAFWAQDVRKAASFENPMLKPLPPLYGVEDNEEQFEPEQRIVPESFGEGFEWYVHTAMC